MPVIPICYESDGLLCAGYVNKDQSDELQQKMNEELGKYAKLLYLEEFEVELKYASWD